MFLAPPPWSLARGQKVKYHLISITKSISKILISNFVCVLKIKDTKHIRRVFYSVTWVMPFGWDYGVLRGQNQIPSCCLSVMLSPPKPFGRNSTKFGVWVTHINGAHNVKIFLAPPPWSLGRGQKVKHHLISITKSISEIFIPNFVCVLTNERYKTYQMEFLFCHLGHAPGWDFGALGHVAYQIDGDDEQYRMQVTFSS